MTPKEPAEKVKTVFVSGMFNVLHPGHFRFLKYAKSLGHTLVVGVLSDADAPEATVSENERQQNISALSFVDETLILSTPVEDYIRNNKPDIVVKGWEHHDQENSEKKALSTYGGQLIFSSGDITISGPATGEGDKNSTLKTISKPQDFFKRHRFSSRSLQSLLEKFESLNICVIGDIIIDEYVNCQAVGMSREDPTIVVRPADSQLYLGGAGIVAAHAKGLGAEVHFISITGEDKAGRFTEKKLREYGVNAYIFKDASRPTTQKKRYRASGKTMLRVNEYSDHPISDEISEKIITQLKNLIHDLDVIIFSDFSYGMLTQDVVDEITSIAQKNGIIIAADSQTSSQIGNITRFKNATLITPTEHEARGATKNYADGLVKLSENVRELSGARHVVITLAEEGVFVSEQHNKTIVNDRLPAFQAAAIDAAGAGDAMLVTTAMGLAAGGNIWECIYLGSLASAVQVSRVGNIPLQYQELIEVLSS